MKCKMSLMDSVNKAKMFVEQMEEELLNLVETQRIGNPRKDGIFYKIAQAKEALDEIKEPEPEPAKTIQEPVFEKKPAFKHQR